MQGEFKQCPNGHYYQGVSCPYCKTTKQAGSATSMKTEAYVGETEDQQTSVDPTYPTSSRQGTQTTIVEGQSTVVASKQQSPRGYSRTVFGDENYSDESITTNGQAEKRSPQYGRKLVGWLVTYSFDALGVDYKLYEGRNVIGRDVDCNITINDGRMSGKHAVLLFRANKYSLTDSQSSHGTFVNDEDIDLEPRYLKDGDIIRMGNTTFKFRTSL